MCAMFTCWDGGEDEVDCFPSEVEAFDAKSAAESYADEVFGDWDYPEELNIAVKDSRGVVEFFQVTHESVPVFSASPALAIQAYLRGCGSPQRLLERYGIKHYEHPTLPLMGFKYSQTDSPKTHPIVRDARGVVLDMHTWDVVARPFRRFFNVGEDAEGFARFNWSKCMATTKEDGSLILLYYYRGEWLVNTSGSFGLDVVGGSGKTWTELFWEISKIDRAKLLPGKTYVFELCTPFNRVVRTYAEPSAFLLGVFYRSGLELLLSEVERESRHLGVPLPESHRFKSLDDVGAFIAEKERTDKTFEGVVVRDDQGERFKIKSKAYLALHHLKDNGNVFSAKRLLPIVLAGEGAEVLAYMPEAKPYLADVSAKVDKAFDELRGVWWDTYTIEQQRDFALQVVNRTPFSSLLFKLRKRLPPQDQTVDSLRTVWRESADLISRALFN